MKNKHQNHKEKNCKVCGRQFETIHDLSRCNRCKNKDRCGCNRWKMMSAKYCSVCSIKYKSRTYHRKVADKINKIKQLREQGLSLKRIGKRFRVSHETVRTWLKRETTSV